MEWSSTEIALKPNLSELYCIAVAGHKSCFRTTNNDRVPMEIPIYMNVGHTNNSHTTASSITTEPCTSYCALFALCIQLLLFISQ